LLPLQASCFLYKHKLKPLLHEQRFSKQNGEGTRILFNFGSASTMVKERDLHRTTVLEMMVAAPKISSDPLLCSDETAVAA
jgi:hypothetical protein